VTFFHSRNTVPGRDMKSTRKAKGVTDPSQLNRLLRRLRPDCKPETITKATNALGAMGEAVGENPRVVSALVKLFGHPDDDLRACAVTALKKLKCHETAVPLLVESLSGAGALTAEAICFTLGALGPRAVSHPAVVELLEEWSSLRDYRSRRCILQLLQGLPRRGRNQRISTHAIELLWSGGREDRLRSLEILVSASPRLLVDEKIQEVVRQGMSDEDDAVRDLALEALFCAIPDHGDRVLPMLLEPGLKGGDGALRLRCADVIRRFSGGLLEEPEVALLVVDALLNWDPEVRRTAVGVLPSDPSSLCSTPEIRDRFASVVRYGTDDVRGLAEKALRQLG
jgi:hypothetical protein